MITRYALIAVLVLLVAALGWIVLREARIASLSKKVDSLSREVAVQREVADQARLARKVEAAHRKREATRAAQRERALEALLTGDFADADTPIDPRIANYLDCLRRTEGRDAADCAAGLR